jgi:hypothetical protein
MLVGNFLITGELCQSPAGNSSAVISAAID